MYQYAHPTGCSDLPDIAPLYYDYPEVSLVSISRTQRAPMPNANWVATAEAEPLPFVSRPDLGRETPRCGDPRRVSGRGPAGHRRSVHWMTPHRRRALALAGGDDYELCFTVPPSHTTGHELL